MKNTKEDELAIVSYNATKRGVIIGKKIILLNLLEFMENDIAYITNTINERKEPLQESELLVIDGLKIAYNKIIKISEDGLKEISDEEELETRVNMTGES